MNNIVSRSRSQSVTLSEPTNEPNSLLFFVRLTMRISSEAALLLLSTLSVCSAFTCRPAFGVLPSLQQSTAIFAKKKKANKFAGALEALEELEENALLEAPLSKKEQLELAKQNKKQHQKQDPKAAALEALDDLDIDEPLSKKEQMKQHQAAVKQEQPEKKLSAKEAALERALAMEEADSAVNGAASEDDDQPKLSKKELKALKKKEEKMAAKLAKKQAKKEEVDAVAEAPVNGEAIGQVRCYFIVLTSHLAKNECTNVSHLVRHSLGTTS
jgi:hypothetical protein